MKIRVHGPRLRYNSQTMRQAHALGIMAQGHSVFLTGPAGSGKTYVLNQFVRYAKAHGKKVAVTASTGLAATHLGGTTIHAWSGIGINDELKSYHISEMSKNRREQIISADILVIDEVSMLHDYRLDMVGEICRKVREVDAPFGGLQVILCGDFFQLPPVNRHDSREGGFVVHSSSWLDLDPVICYIDEQHRQAGDELLEILTALRAGDIRRRHVEALMARKTVRTPFDEPVTELYTRNVNVDSLNQRMLDAMEAEPREFVMDHTGRARSVEALQKSCLAPEVLVLKIGALVMFVKNSPDKKYVNGTLGTVTGFDELTGYPEVTTKEGKRITALPETWEQRDGDKKIASLTQVPLRLAWAITVHKSQGMTLDAAHIDLSDAFVPGMGYVALSRVKTLQTLTLAGINRMAITMNHEAGDIDQSLRRKSSTDETRLGDLAEVWEKLQTKQKTTKAKPAQGPWLEKLAKMRETFPNAYMPWKEADDVKLVLLFQDGAGLKKLSKEFDRHPGSIRKRLEKHLGEDVVIPK